MTIHCHPRRLATLISIKEGYPFREIASPDGPIFSPRNLAGGTEYCPNACGQCHCQRSPKSDAGSGFQHIGAAGSRADCAELETGTALVKQIALSPSWSPRPGLMHGIKRASFPTTI